MHSTYLRRFDGVDVAVEVRTDAMAGDDDGAAPQLCERRPRPDRRGAPPRRNAVHGAVESGVHEDRDRIARDLHDSVIQRIFAAAMSVAGSPETGGRTSGLDAEFADIVDELDRTMVDIRSMIYRLSPDEPTGDFRSDVLAVMDEDHGPRADPHGPLHRGPREHRWRMATPRARHRP